MNSNFHLSKSLLMAYPQFERRLWLEIPRRDLVEVSARHEARFDAGHRVGELARQLADPEGQGILCDAQRDGLDVVLRATTQAMSEVDGNCWPTAGWTPGRW